MKDNIAIYIHWPFCEAKCPYCDFNSHVTENINHAKWKSSLLNELAHYASETGERTVTSLYFGGGTPSLMKADTVAAIIDSTEKTWGFSNNPEITLEANPSSTETTLLKDYFFAGVNRVSLGIQSLNQENLSFLGRRHTVYEAKQALNTAKEIFDHISFDVIYGLPGQDIEAWHTELVEALAMAQDHLSAYQLTIEPGTAFFKNHVEAVDESLGADLFALTRTLLSEAGLPAYEVSNHARVGGESRHNLSCWQGQDYIGIGPGAHGRLTVGGKFIATHQIHNPKSWLNRVAHSGHGTGKRRQLRANERAFEIIITGLRLARGLNTKLLQNQTGLKLNQLLDPIKTNLFLRQGLLFWNDDFLVATEKGIACLNTLISTIMISR
ncbi:MAG: coproporphyrinogen III oxidase [Magnetovibrio sp.]|nr:coproporphyrinogen III oxidase [Magnetovibrio sp.]|tara:strand:+ start:1200 stop:2345 length:1146 start_codon:yes stop_codon:yes gene_type:complete